VNKRSATEEDLRDIQNAGEMEGYRFPGLDLLEEPEVNYSVTMEAYVREQAGALERALKEYRIDGEVVGIESGPVITLYEVKLAPGTKVAALAALSSDLARSLKAVNIRIVPNTVGRDTVGIEVPNAHKEKVRLKELMTKLDQAARCVSRCSWAWTLPGSRSSRTSRRCRTCSSRAPPARARACA
jgi:S-DNA-T family DNA segregation ATPase FtsK/SpoIIIE